MLKRWGWMLTLLKGKEFKVKLLYFEKDQGISMQRHQNRSELWLLIFGGGVKRSKFHPAEVPFKKGEYFWIGSGVWHQFTAEKPTLVLEIQYGDKCSERDIERA